jgi:hypothetical protein
MDATQQLIEKLRRIANNEHAQVTFNKVAQVTRLDDLPSSGVNWDIKTGLPKQVFMYYVSETQLLFYLAHEVGHIVTMRGGKIHEYLATKPQKELEASQWALNFIRPYKDEVDWVSGLEWLQEALNTYTWNIKEEYILK